MNRTAYLQPLEVKSDIFRLFDLDDIYPGYRLLINLSTPIISLVLKERQEPAVVAQRLLASSEIRVLLPVLTFAPCCPQEVLQASYSCAYDVLLQALFSSDARAIAHWDGLVQEHRLRLTRASQEKTRRQEMKSVYNALFALRQKLEQLGLTIRSRQGGFYLSTLAHQEG